MVAKSSCLDLINDDQISGLEEFLTAIEDQRTREAIVELLEAKQTTNEKEATSRMKTIMRMLPNDVSFLEMIGAKYVFIVSSYVTDINTLRLHRFLTLTGCIVVLTLCIYLIHQFYWRRRHLPPGPIPLPLLGNTLSVDMRHPASTFSQWHALYGPIYTVWLPHPMIVLASHDVLRDTLIKQASSRIFSCELHCAGPSFSGRPCGYIWSMFTQNSTHGDGIILCEGQRSFYHTICIFYQVIVLDIFRNFGLGKTTMEEKIIHHIEYMIGNIDAKLYGKTASDETNI
uniref:Cytochrome P450 n=1 Tax=Heterorhabditis bacteriophora TaxID=37862 RepID=A0A1I7XP47_HETBA